ncbi:hypothetical protein DEO72_LG6g1023 [Vigna unguiculata]|uniref:Uncharacterized protein n=1 Tax=Vigna unguiculata TaxID=3917 RepID=A0A4D6M7E3_VIGUN|nr:hypothetical protein DEO72_LG6g1023 [Vigna unguiculata]
MEPALATATPPSSSCSSRSTSPGAAAAFISFSSATIHVPAPPLRSTVPAPTRLVPAAHHSSHGSHDNRSFTTIFEQEPPLATPPFSRTCSSAPVRFASTISANCVATLATSISRA